MLESLKQESIERKLNHKIIFLGYIDEATKSRLLLASDIFVMPSPTELLSIATLEAMAHGCAVLVASYPSSAVAEVVGEAGVVYDPHDMALVVNYLEQLLASGDIASYRQRALDIAKYHDIEVLVEAIERVFSHHIAQNEAKIQARHATKN